MALGSARDSAAADNRKCSDSNPRLHPRRALGAHWLPLVLGPALAMLSRPGRSCFSAKPSSSNFSPYMLSPPLCAADPLHIATCMSCMGPFLIPIVLSASTDARDGVRYAGRAEAKASCAGGAHVPLRALKSPPCGGSGCQPPGNLHVNRHMEHKRTRVQIQLVSLA